MTGEESGRDPARSFGGVADAYERGRPTYPTEAAVWLSGESPLRVLELGAGTGKLTRELLHLGHTVIATDPDPAMLDVLEREAPGAAAAVGTAEEIDAPDGSVDVVIGAQCFHWFDADRALPEIARVLRPGGRVSLVWNERDERIPWVKRLGSLIGSVDFRDPTEAIDASGLFGEVQAAEFKFRQLLDRESVQDLALSRSTLAVLDDAARRSAIVDVLALYDEYGRGMDGMLLPYFSRCFRAVVDTDAVRRLVVGRHADRDADDPDQLGPDGDQRGPDDTMPRGLRARHRQAGNRSDIQSDPADDDLLLIDFR